MDNSCLEKFILEYKFGDSAGINEILLLKGCLSMYEKTGKKVFEDIIEENYKKYVSEDGELKVSEDAGAYIFEMGRCLMFLDKEGVCEKYNKALAKLYNKLRALNCEDEDTILYTLTHILPFYMSYETLLNKKSNYNDIVAKAKQLYDLKFDSNTNRYSDSIIEEARYLDALADTTLATAEEIYEHFNFFKMLLKEAVKGIISYIDKTDMLNTDDNENIEAMALILAAVKKACKSGAVLSEKYEEFINKAEEALNKSNLRNENCAAVMAAFMQ